MNKYIKVDNYIITTPLPDILDKLKFTLTNGKLRDIEVKSDDITVTCPVHSNGLEANPDCHINYGKNKTLPIGIVHCFSCGFTGTFDKFVAECFGCSIELAQQWLIKNFDSHKAFEKVDVGDDIVFGQQSKVAHKTTSKYMNPQILDSYQDWCPYLAQRKLTRDICKRFNVKYDPQYRQVVFPVYDTAGHILMMPKRSIDTKVFYLDKNCDKPVYCLDQIINNNIDKCIITEGPFDCLTAWQYGFPAIATLGELSPEQIDKVSQSGIKVLYTMFDNDNAGRRFADFLNNKISKRILVINIRIPDPYKDINDLSYEKFWEIINKIEK